MASEKMYQLNQTISLPERILVSECMYKLKGFYSLPVNIKDTYYKNEVPATKPKTMNNTNKETNEQVKSLSGEVNMNELKVRQSNILDKLKEIKEKLCNLKLVSPAANNLTSSNWNFSLPSGADNYGDHLLAKIEGLKTQLLQVKRVQPPHEQNIIQFEDWQSMILKQLLCLKEDMIDIGTKARRISFQNEEENLKAKQKSIIYAVDELQNLLRNEVASLQVDLQVFEAKSNPCGVGIESYHKEVLQMIEVLQKELKHISILLENTKPVIKVPKSENTDHPRSHTERNEEIRSTCQQFEFLIKTPHGNGSVIHDVVVSANPASPPYFLLAVKKFLEPKVRVLSSSKAHSSVSCVDPQLLRQFQDDDFKFRSDYDVAFTVVWKDQPMKSLMVSPLLQCAIVGEANILRYLSRLFPNLPPLSYESQGNANNVSETDHYLDTIQGKLLHGNNKERQSVLKQLNSRLGTSQWLGDKSCGLADVFAWSVIIQLGLFNEGLPNNVSNWYKRIDGILGLNLGTSSETVNEPEQSERALKRIDRQSLEEFLRNNDIEYQVRDHKEVFTVNALMECVSDMPGLHMKNLFLKDKKKNLYLLCVRHNAQVKLQEIGKEIGAKELRFADESVLEEVLGVKQGCVTIFALLNDPVHTVTVLLDNQVYQSNHSYINFHPMTNAATLGISPQNLDKFLKLSGHKVMFIDI